ncbi:hypothetical protein JW948_17360 [bacterium]|nr:hypothetical protein [bacterium]
MIHRFRFVISAVLVLLALPVLLPAQYAETDSFRLKRDLRIMEGILDKLIDRQQVDMRMPGVSKGIYIPEYGMIFYMKKIQPYEPVMLKALEQNLNQVLVNQAGSGQKRRPQTAGEPVFRVQGEHYEKFRQETEKLEKEALDHMQDGIIEFLSNYASSMSLLKDRDKIAVLVHLEGWRSLPDQNGFMTAWIDRKQAETLRQSRAADADARSGIHIDMKSDDTNMKKDIDIMTEILNQAMTTGPNPQYASTSGLYMKGLGALIFMEIQPALWFGNMDSLFSVVIHNSGDAVSGYSFTANAGISARPGGQQGNRAQLNKLRDELFDLMASYGHTLKLKPDEQIIIDVNLGSNFTLIGFNNDPTNMRLQLTKRYLDDYNERKIGLKDLKKKLIVQYL